VSVTATMAHWMQRSAQPVVSLPRAIKRAVAITVDVCLCILATWLAFYLRLDTFVALTEELTRPVILSIAIALPIFAATGLYRAIFRYSGWPAILAVARAMALYGLVYMSVVMAIGLDGTPRTIGVLQPLLLFFAVASSRLLARFWLGSAYQSRVRKDTLPRALIYGAGAAGRQLAGALNAGYEMQAIGFIDDDDRLQGHVLNGLPVFAAEDLLDLIPSKQITHVLLAMPSLARARRNQILQRIAQQRVIVRTLPSMADLAEGRVTINDIKDLDIDDLLGRESISPDHLLLSRKITGKTVMVTGAGGSIGGELCRQIIALQPVRLILVENNEYALYAIHSELDALQSRLQLEWTIEVDPVLCSVQDSVRIQDTMRRWRPYIVYHAAAYKHVPLVEQNVLDGIKNNVFGTLCVVNAAIQARVADCVLVSTDKAVRPTNVMGATKRLAEMVLQALQVTTAHQTCLSMVRFGNVLASSGSVIPKFRAQIRAGGPITVTHPEVNRFFMTIPEAAQLVIQAGALAEGGEVFVLDMGKPVKIIDLARQMIQLSGLLERSEDQLDGDIAIEITGLRAGEKLYEELLIGNNPESTVHPKILKANEAFVAWQALEPKLQELLQSIEASQVSDALKSLEELVDGFHPKASHDDSYAEQTGSN